MRKGLGWLGEVGKKVLDYSATMDIRSKRFDKGSC